MTAADHYPVRQRREPRRLNPNQAGIQWLEEQSADDCEIEVTIPLTLHPEVQILCAHGHHSRSYNRPMCEPIDDDAYSGPAPHGVACTGCGDFSRSWTCSDHGRPAPRLTKSLLEILEESYQSIPAAPTPAPDWARSRQPERTVVSFESTSGPIRVTDFAEDIRISWTGVHDAS